jgi:hypothetical protein
LVHQETILVLVEDHADAVAPRGWFVDCEKAKIFFGVRGIKATICISATEIIVVIFLGSTNATAVVHCVLHKFSLLLARVGTAPLQVGCIHSDCCEVEHALTLVLGNAGLISLRHKIFCHGLLWVRCFEGEVFSHLVKLVLSLFFLFVV